MGLFDDVICSAMLPGHPPNFVGPGYRFQTKDLPEPYLRLIEITDDRRLTVDGEDLAFHGDLRFYAGRMGVRHGVRDVGPDGRSV